ncbi:MAG TPA: serine protease, partial [Terriglobales bacterium]|nr:serine protease [Terriglobales bacterium]
EMWAPITHPEKGRDVGHPLIYLQWGVRMRNLLLLCAIWMPVLAAECEQHLPLKTVVAQTQPYLIKITERVENPAALTDASLRERFLANPKLVIGTGFIVSKEGEVVTADHVVRGMRDFEARIRRAGTESRAMLGVTPSGIEVGGNTISGNSVVYPFQVMAEDGEHDLAILRVVSGDILNPPRASMVVVNGKPVVSLHPRPATISTKHLEDGDEVYASGFPLDQDSPVTTVGTVASAWGTAVLANAQASGINRESEVVDLDMRINSGNSGGPLSLYADQSVVGVVVEVRAGQASSGAVAVAVPVKYIKAFLDQNHIKWLPAKARPFAR